VLGNEEGAGAAGERKGREMRPVSLAAAYLGLALVAIAAMWLALRFESVRQDKERSPRNVRFADVPVTDGATFRVQDDQIVTIGPKPPGLLSRDVMYANGPGVPDRVLNRLLAGLCGSTLTLAIIVMILVRRERNRARAIAPFPAGAAP
jgi:hypothetical protein